MLRSPAGLLSAEATSYEVEFTRMDRVSRRVFSGLYYHHYGFAAASAGIEIVSYCWDGVNNDGRAKVEPLVLAALSARRHTIHDSVFCYWFREADDEPRASIWVAEYYTSTHFIGILTPIEA